MKYLESYLKYNLAFISIKESLLKFIENSLLSIFLLPSEIEIIGYAKKVMLKIERYNEMQTNVFCCSNLFEIMQQKVSFVSFFREL